MFEIPLAAKVSYPVRMAAGVQPVCSAAKSMGLAGFELADFAVYGRRHKEP